MWFQEAKMVIARAYRQTEKLLQDNKEKLALVSSAYFDRVSAFLYIYSHKTGGALVVFISHNRQIFLLPVGQYAVGA